MKELLMKRTSVIALACALAAVAVIGIGVAQANAANLEAEDAVAVEERIDGDASSAENSAVLEANDKQSAEENATVEEPEKEAAGAVEDGAAEANVSAEDEPVLKAEKKNARAEATATESNVSRDDYIELEEMSAEEYDAGGFENVSVSDYIDEDEEFDAIAELPAE